MAEPKPNESWKTPRIRAAETALAAAATAADTAIAKAARLKRPARPLSDAEVRRFERAAKAPGASEPLKRLQRRVDTGGLSWRDIAEGRALRDPEVVTALRLSIEHIDFGPLRDIRRQLQEGNSTISRSVSFSLIASPFGDWLDHVTVTPS